MFGEKAGSTIVLAAVATAAVFALLTGGVAHAVTEVPVKAPAQGAVQQTAPMTATMPGPGMAGGEMPMDHAMPGQDAMPGQPGAGQGGMGAMMGTMAKMQGMMARMQRMMASDTMSGTVPMAGNMGEMMDMMGEMQEMMAQMQGMMAGEMMAGDMAAAGQMQGQQMQGGAAMGGQMQGQPMQGGMMAQMPMMGTVIVIAPMPMNGMQMPMMPMMQGMDMSGMMGQMPMMQGMEMGGMAGQNAAPGGAPAPVAAAGTASDTAQSGALGAIEVKVTPPDLTNIQGDTIDFTVDLNATGVDLGLDLSKDATLRIGEHEMAAIAWEIAYDHGHHVNGVLKFPAHMSGPVASATLSLSDPAGGPELTLTWPPVE